MKSKFLDRLSSGVVVADGAMGTAIQTAALSSAEYSGYDGCNEYLCVSKPEFIKQIHCSYFEAGADYVETNTFGASRVVLQEYKLQNQVDDINRAAVVLAKEAAVQYSTPEKPRFIAGAVGPGTKLPTLGQISFKDLYGSYFEQIKVLVESGVDLIQIETCQDLLQIKAAVVAALDAMDSLYRRIPIAVSFTVEKHGTLLLGTELTAALATLEALDIDIIGLNCATGPDLMREHVRALCQSSARPILVMPNAGLPIYRDGVASYDLSPEEFAQHLEGFVRDHGVSIVGGCCGTTSAHIIELTKRVSQILPKERRSLVPPQLSSTYAAVNLDQEGSSPLLIGERCNANGSKQFRELLMAENWDGIVELAREEVEQGAHAVDVCAACVGRNELSDMATILRRFSRELEAPIMIDSTQPEVIEEALRILGGRSIINSINLEEGEKKLGKICTLAKKYGAALVALTIDEEGMARTAERKLTVAKRIFDLCTKRYKLSPDALVFDALTFTVASREEEGGRAAKETLDGVARIKKEIPNSRTILGVSNVSYGLKPQARQILNSVFLAEARKHGLDLAIVHAKKVLPVFSIPENQLRLALDILYDRRCDGYDPLLSFISEVSLETKEEDLSAEQSASVEEQIKKALIAGRKSNIEALLDCALKDHSALEIVNEILLEGMKKVGELFGSGQMQLPFVLQSAEVMKRAVGYLEKYLDHGAQSARGKIVLATVRGDVHDIGKNLVDIILSNNGYEVINLGIKQSLDEILEALKKHQPDALGMSGLLVKSAHIMKENLEEMTKRSVRIPVICGGAALNRNYVEGELRRAYGSGQVYYGADAFSGLKIMQELCGNTEGPTDKRTSKSPKREGSSFRGASPSVEEDGDNNQAREASFHQVPNPPFWGSKIVGSEDLDLEEILKYIDKRALYIGRWMYKIGSKATAEHKRFLETEVESLFDKWKERAVNEKLLEPSLVYGYFPCQSQGNTLMVFSPDNQAQEICRMEFPRVEANGRMISLANYFLPAESGRKDLVAFQLVTVGSKVAAALRELYQAGQYSDYLHLHGLSVETAEALAEYWHKQVRRELGIDKDDASSIEEIHRGKYQGLRVSFGYPVCPRLEYQQYIFNLLRPERVGVSLSSEFQLIPEQSTSGMIIHCSHP